MLDIDFDEPITDDKDTFDGLPNPDEIKKEKKQNEEINNSGGLFENILNAGKGGKSSRQGYVEMFTKQIIRSLGSRLVTKIVRGILGSMK